MTAGRVDDLLGQIPARPLVALRVLQRVEDPEASLAAVATMVSMDPALSTRILRLANSSAYAGIQSAISVERAVMRLGMQTVGAVVAAGAVSLVRDDVNLGPSGFWAHALGVAAAAATAAGPLGVSADEAFSVGILHDIGTALQHQADSEAYALLDRVREPSSRLAREREIFGADHAQLGSEAVASWGFPDPLVEAIRDHHSSPRTVSRLTQAVIVGEAVAAALEDVAPNEPVMALADLLGDLRVPIRPDTLIGETRQRCNRLASLAESSS